MKIKHKLIQDFQYVSPDKKIFVLKSGTILEEYNYKLKSEIIPIDKDLIDANPQFFELIDWKAELMSYMKVNKMPQPAQLGKKLIPFIEEMVLSSIQQNVTPSIDSTSLRDIERRENELNSLKRDLDRRESDLDSRDRRIKDREDEIEVRMKRVEKREDEYKLDLKNLEKKDDELRSKSRQLAEKEIDIQDKVQQLNERERNLDKTALLSAKEYDSKYTELQSKIDNDLKSLSKKEKELELEKKRVQELETKLENNVNQLVESSKNKIYSDLETELRGIESEIRHLDTLVKNLNGFNHPVVAQVGSELTRAISRLKERVDNNLID